MRIGARLPNTAPYINARQTWAHTATCHRLQSMSPWPPGVPRLKRKPQPFASHSSATLSCSRWPNATELLKLTRHEPGPAENTRRSASSFRDRDIGKKKRQNLTSEVPRIHRGFQHSRAGRSGPLWRLLALDPHVDQNLKFVFRIFVSICRISGRRHDTSSVTNYELSTELTVEYAHRLN